MPVDALIIGKAGPKFKDSAPDATTRMRPTVTLSTVASTFTGSQVSDLVRLLSAAADRPVVDQTGLTGFYDFKIEFARDPAASLFTAVQEPLGLKLEPRRGDSEEQDVGRNCILQRVSNPLGRLSDTGEADSQSAADFQSAPHCNLKLL